MKIISIVERKSFRQLIGKGNNNKKYTIMRAAVLTPRTIANRIAMAERIKSSRTFVEDEVTFNPFVTTDSPKMN